MLGDDLLAQPLERDPSRGGDEPLVALLERADQLLVALVERRRQRALDPGEERPPAGVAADQDERVVRDADERRGEHRDERLVVVAVAQQPQVEQQVDHLLLAEVAAPGARGRSAARASAAPPRTTRRRCRPRTGARSRPALAAPSSTSSRTRRATCRASARRQCSPPLAIRRLVGDEQLDRMAEDRVGELARGRERLEAVAERGLEEVVDGGEHLGPRAVVLRQRQPLRPPRRAAARKTSTSAWRKP